MNGLLFSECEKAARRGARLKQVRAQSMAAARDVRQRVRREQDNLVKATAKQQLAAFIRYHISCIVY